MIYFLMLLLYAFYLYLFIFMFFGLQLLACNSQVGGKCVAEETARLATQLSTHPKLHSLDYGKITTAAVSKKQEVQSLVDQYDLAPVPFLGTESGEKLYGLLEELKSAMATVQRYRAGLRTLVLEKSRLRNESKRKWRGERDSFQAPP